MEYIYNRREMFLELYNGTYQIIHAAKFWQPQYNFHTIYIGFGLYSGTFQCLQLTSRLYRKQMPKTEIFLAFQFSLDIYQSTLQWHMSNPIFESKCLRMIITECRCLGTLHWHLILAASFRCKGRLDISVQMHPYAFDMLIDAHDHVPWIMSG